MNVSTLRYETHNDSDIDVNGTSYQGEISKTFENLLKVFGTPMGASDDNKVCVLEYFDKILLYFSETFLSPDLILN